MTFIVGKEMIVRTCVMTTRSLDVSQCIDFTVDDVEARSCFCSTDKCNSGVRLHTQLTYLLNSFTYTLSLIVTLMFS